MVFLQSGDNGDYLNAKKVIDEGLVEKIATILDEGDVHALSREGEKDKTVIDFKIEVDMKTAKAEDNLKLVYTPNKTNRKIWEEAWGETRTIDGKEVFGLDTAKLVGKQFKIGITKVLFRGKMVDSVVTEPIKKGEKVVEGKKVKAVKI